VKIYTTKAEQFCHDISSLIDINRTKAFVGIVMALGSEVTASNPTNLSLSPFFQYHYSITSKVMKEIDKFIKRIKVVEIGRAVKI